MRKDSVKDGECGDSTSSSEEELPVSRSRNDAATQSIQKDLVLVSTYVVLQYSQTLIFLDSEPFDVVSRT